MKIVTARPPNFDAIVAVIPRAANSNVLFAYGDTIYSPGGGEISTWILAHEQIHSMRQGRDPEAWWTQYLADPVFRFDEELFAHRVEWTTWEHGGARNRHDRRAMMRVIAGRLSGPLYGGVVDFEAAKKMILAEAKS